MLPELNNPWMTVAEVRASVERGNQIAAAIRAGTYRPAIRSTVPLANKGYQLEKWEADASTACQPHGYGNYRNARVIR